MIRAVIFDLDNTLVDFMKMKRESVADGHANPHWYFPPTSLTLIPNKP